MEEKKIILSESALTAGIVLDAAGVALITKSNFGITAVSALPYTLSQSFPVLTYGTWYYCFQVSLMLLLVLLTRKFKKDYIIAFVVGFLFSFVLDIAAFLFGFWPDTLPFQIIYFVSGTLLLMIGVAFLMNSGLPIMPQDLFTKDFSSFIGIPFKRVKTLFDVSCVAISCLIALLAARHLIGIGAGTLLSACINGYGISFFRDHQKTRWTFEKKWLKNV